MAGSSGVRPGVTAVMKRLSRPTVADNMIMNQLPLERIGSRRQLQLARAGMDRDFVPRTDRQGIPLSRLDAPCGATTVTTSGLLAGHGNGNAMQVPPCRTCPCSPVDVAVLSSHSFSLSIDNPIHHFGLISI
jgi:hypothetical protein